MNTIDPFELEKRRTWLAKTKNLSELRLTYSSKYPEIKNKNTPGLWDNLNLEGNHFTKSDDHQARDKLSIVSRNILGKNISVLNVGFGSGNLERLVYKKKYIRYWTGVDFSPKSVKHARDHFPNYHFLQGNIEKLKFKDQTFDYLVCLEVLEHVSPHQILKSLKEFNRVLKVGGTLIVSVPLNEDLKMMIKLKQNINQHVRIYTPELIKAELELSGFAPFKEVRLISFRNYYWIKKVITNFLLPGIRKENGITVFAKKV